MAADRRLRLVASAFLPRAFPSGGSGLLNLRRGGQPLGPEDLMLGCAFVNSKLGQDGADDATASATVQAAYACGIRDLDTAPYYGPSEDRVGKALRALPGGASAGGGESDMRVVTKVGIIRPQD
eukprot:COSAG05_NODE_14096_length_408_cov_0.838188_1_plen_123_part_01